MGCFGWVTLVFGVFFCFPEVTIDDISPFGGFYITSFLKPSTLRERSISKAFGDVHFGIFGFQPTELAFVMLVKASVELRGCLALGLSESMFTKCEEYGVPKSKYPKEQRTLISYWCLYWCPSFDASELLTLQPGSSNSLPDRLLRKPHKNQTPRGVR